MCLGLAGREKIYRAVIERDPSKVFFSQPEPYVPAVVVPLSLGTGLFRLPAGGLERRRPPTRPGHQAHTCPCIQLTPKFKACLGTRSLLPCMAATLIAGCYYASSATTGAGSSSTSADPIAPEVGTVCSEQAVLTADLKHCVCRAGMQCKGSRCTEGPSGHRTRAWCRGTRSLFALTAGAALARWKGPICTGPTWAAAVPAWPSLTCPD